MFGFHAPVVSGIMEHTVTWAPSWAESFTAQLQDVLCYDTETNRSWPELEAAYRRLVDAVIPRLLGVLQSNGREIIPTLIHGDVWEANVGIDRETGKSLVFDAGSTYAHNEFEFRNWRCILASYFSSPEYMRLYQRHIKPSDPAEEWDDRQRLYCIYTHLNVSAGHAGNITRELAFNDILYLCEKYAPLETLEKYNPGKDVGMSPSYAAFATKQMKVRKSHFTG
ncbi:hypothetical protein BR93DRAFT_984563 [Coniochaeta sp. PMI_546]|nr:hypothetical protein BR93DRAFT_984563 [Coniochaeta sp. PMI_546]